MFGSQYQPLKTEQSSNDTDEDTAQASKSLAHRKPRLAIATISTAFMVMALVLAFSYRHAKSSKSWKDISCACGTSATEAIANGCVFDFYSMTWLPDNCRDDDLIALFTKLGQEQHHNWTLFELGNERELQSEDAALLAGDPFHPAKNQVGTTRGWHGAHCLMLGERQQGWVWQSVINRNTTRSTV
ncbi:hypothetical protein LTR10_003516 [Elasticomyces elasticus]|nr:hypothetical protein LTR10_003516 [Elasticomyces elasticus]KAK4969784.1 hypothetical protein LTR42_009056 [Elasticomyces elasticus]